MNKDKIKLILEQYNTGTIGYSTDIDAAAETIAALFTEHPASESPPEHERTVLTLVERDDGTRAWRLNAWYKSEIFDNGWLFRLNKVICWRELPSVPEVTA